MYFVYTHVKSFSFFSHNGLILKETSWYKCEMNIHSLVAVAIVAKLPHQE